MASGAKVGNPFDNENQMGAIVSKVQFDKASILHVAPGQMAFYRMSLLQVVHDLLILIMLAAERHLDQKDVESLS